jgi:hypothetical protein
MCAALVGGMDRLRREYIEAARHLGVDLKVFTGKERGIAERIGGAELVMLLTGKVSHAARDEVVAYTRAKNITLRQIHSSGVSALRRTLDERAVERSVAGKTAPAVKR